MDIPVNSIILIISAVILLVGVAAVSIANKIAYKKSNLKKMLSQYETQRRAKSSTRSNVRNNYNYYRPDNGGYDHDQMMQQQMNDDFNRQMQQQMNDEFNRQAMEHTMNEGWKSVTPFDHGGYVQGPGFNPSDTAAQQMNDMNNMNMGMF